GARLLTDYTEFIPAATTGMAAQLFSQLAIANQSQPIFNTVFTNVPGPQKPLYFSGAQMVNQYGLGIIQDGQGLFHSVLSYNGNLSICAVCDKAMMPDHDFYADCLRESAEELKTAIGG
ncbi:MAG: WS/DGAT domain-containing protein, partial [Alphaproteobacteria bacterium]|nr:WS/DGAT domain-containing protein [Alphaproteobacteria bacterium]